MGTIGDKLSYLDTTKTLIKKGLNNLGSELTNEPFRDYADSLQDIYDMFPKVHGNGVDIKLPTIKGKMLVEVLGRKEQKQLIGSNKLDEETIKNTTFSEGTYKYALTNIQGSTLYFKAALKEGKTPINGIYVAISSNGANPNNGTSIFSVRNGSITTESNDFTNVSNIYFSVYPKTVSIQELFKTYNFWVSDTDTTYEEYCGGQASPNPNYPQPIENPKGNITIEKYTKNFFDINEVNHLALSSVFLQNSSYRGFYIRVRPGQKYTISRASTSAPNRFRVCFTKVKPAVNGKFYNSNGTEGAYDNLGDVTSGTITVPTEMNYMFLYLSNANETITTTMEIQIELGETKTTYSEGDHESVIFTLNPNQALMENGYLDSAGIHNTYGLYTLTGNEDWEILSTASTYVQFGIRRTAISNTKLHGEVLSNYFTQTETDRAALNNVYMGDNYFNVCIDVNIASTVEQFTQWLQDNATNNNPVVIQYELDTAETQEYSSTQQEQFEAIDNLLTYNGYTYIQSYSDDLPPTLDVTALKPIISTSDATAIPGDILIGKTAYVNDEKLTGTLGTESKTVKSSNQSQTITPTSGKLINEVVVEPVVLQTKSVSITQNGTTSVTPDTGNDGLDEVSIDVDVEADLSEYFGTNLYQAASGSFTSTTGIAGCIRKIPSMTAPINMDYMFAHCFSLQEIPLINTSAVTSMAHTFDGCTSLTAIPLLNTSNVTTMGNMFLSCRSLTTIPQLNTSNVLSMQGLFSYCTGLVSIPQLNTSKVTNMVGLFSDCTNLVDVPTLNAKSISNNTRMRGMFTNCSSLSDTSLNNILATCITATKITANKTLNYIGLTSAQATRCESLSNWTAFTNAGWSKGY